jgi:hypothetical protein
MYVLDIMYRQMGRQRQSVRNDRKTRLQRPPRSISHGCFWSNAFDPFSARSHGPLFYPGAMRPACNAWRSAGQIAENAYAISG